MARAGLKSGKKPPAAGRPKGAAAATARAAAAAAPLGTQQAAAVLAAYVALYLLVFSSVFTTPFAFLDDAYLLAGGYQHNLQGYMRQIILGGRDLMAGWTALVWPHVHTMGQIGPVRLVTLAGLGFLAWTLFLLLRRGGMSDALAAPVAALACLMPPFQVYAVWATTALFPWAAAAACWAAVIADDPRPRRQVGGGLLLLAAILIYQPAAMAYWVGVAVRCLLPRVDAASLARRFARSALVAVVALAAGYAIVKVGPIVFYHAPNADPRIALAHDPLAKLAWFAGHPLVDALNFPSIVPSGPGAALVGCLLLAGLMAHFRSRSPRNVLVRLSAAIVLLPLAYLPNLVVAEDFPSYRTQPALAALLVVYAGIGLMAAARALQSDGRRLVPAVLAAALLACAVTAARNVQQEFVYPQAAEFGLLKDTLLHAPLKTARSIYLIPPTYADSAAPVARYDEFGLPSTWPAWMGPTEVHLALLQVAPQFAGLPVRVAPAGKAPAPPPGSAVVDMRPLFLFRP